MTKLFTCAGCEGTTTVAFDGSASEVVPRGTWSTHGFTAVTGRIDKVVTVYSCSPQCAKRIATMPPTEIVHEALEWLEAE